MLKQVAAFTGTAFEASRTSVRRAASSRPVRITQFTPWQRRCYAKHKPAKSPLADEKKRKSRSAYYSMKGTEDRKQFALEAKPRVIHHISMYLHTSTPARNHGSEAIYAFAKAFAGDLLGAARRTEPMSSDTFAHHLRIAPDLTPDDLCGLAVYLERKAHIGPRVTDYGVGFASAKLLYTLSCEGYVLATAILLCSQVRGHIFTPNITQTDYVKRDLAKLTAYFEEHAEIIFQSQSLDRVDAKHLEGLVWKRMGEDEKALACMEQSWRLIEEGARNNMTDSARQTGPRLNDLFRLAAPLWSDLYDAYLESFCGYVLVSSVHPQSEQQQTLQDLLEKMSKVLTLGLFTDDALAHFAFANFQRIQSEVEAQSQAPEGPISSWLVAFAKRRLETQRSVVDTGTTESSETELSIDRSETWLFHMLRAAASGLPQAAHELGIYYEKKARGLGADAPDAENDVISQQQTAVTAQASLIQRVFAMVGLRSTDADRHGKFAHEKNSNQGLARQWYQTAAQAWFAPSYLALARLSLSELEAARAVEDATTSSALEHRVESVLRNCIRAAESQRNFEDVTSWEITDDIVSKENKLLYSKEFGFIKWRLFDDVFRSWVAPQDSHYEDMSARTAELCRTFGKDVYAEDGVLLYRHT